MSDEPPTDAELQSVLEVLADPECREILGVLEEPLSTNDVSERCELPQTSAYRKLEALSEAGLVREGTDLRPDGHHVTTYERAATGIMVALDEGACPTFELVRESERADQRLAQLWSRISEEL